MKTTLCLFLATFCCLTILGQTNRYVRAGGTGSGSTWSDASGNLQQMINASSSGDAVWVAEGIYTPTNLIVNPLDDTQPVERRSTFTIHTGISIYGGFAATGNPGMGDRDFEQYTSILSGDIGAAEDSTDNCFHVVFFPGTADAVLDGFTIHSGTANGNSATGNAESYVPSLSITIPNYKGGAIYLHNAQNNTIANCNFISNRATYEGGAVYLSGGINEFLNNHFEYNIGGGYGGAIFGFQATCTIDGNVFQNNRVGHQSGGPFPMPTPAYYTSGGAVALNNGNLTLLNSTFIENTAHTNISTNIAEGGALMLDNGNHVISYNTFGNNQSTYLPTGVQICAGGAISLSQGNSLITYNDFFDNLTHGSGGAMYIGNGNHLMFGNRFTANHSVGKGGALWCSGTSIDAVNNIFELNSGDGNGGAIHSSFNSGTNNYVNNTFYANSTTNEGAAIYLDGRTDNVLNNIFWENAVNGSTMGSFVVFYNSVNSTLEHNLIQQGSEVDGNISGVNPQFVDAANGDFTPGAASPCINAGSNVHYLSTYDEVDFSGNPRFYNETIDMGAIEAQIVGNPVSVISADKDVETLQWFPNPSSSFGSVQVITTQNGDLRVYDTNGRLYMVTGLKRGLNTIEIQLEPGIYFARQHLLTSLKFVVQ